MYKELIKAMRCGSTPMNEHEPDCKNCKYACKEELRDGTAFPPDIFDEDGKAYLIYCDSDKMMQDAADLLEWINKEAAYLLKDTEEETNLDVLRKMSADSLGRWLCNTVGDCGNCRFLEKCYKGHTGAISWLKEKADVEE